MGDFSTRLFIMLTHPLQAKSHKFRTSRLFSLSSFLVTVSALQKVSSICCCCCCFIALINDNVYLSVVLTELIEHLKARFRVAFVYKLHNNSDSDDNRNATIDKQFLIEDLDKLDRRDVRNL